MTIPIILSVSIPLTPAGISVHSVIDKSDREQLQGIHEDRKVVKVDKQMTCDFTSFLTIFQLYQTMERC